jgi:hypothetical protein
VFTSITDVLQRVRAGNFPKTTSKLFLSLIGKMMLVMIVVVDVVVVVVVVVVVGGGCGVLSFMQSTFLPFPSTAKFTLNKNPSFYSYDTHSCCM